MQKNPVKDLVLASLFVSLGLLLPAVFHVFGLGKAFLPMHIPVILAGFMLGAPYAALVGAVTPFLSSALTGMPVFYPVMPSMVAELMVYALVTSVLSRRSNVYLALLGSMAAGRIAAGLAVWSLVFFLGAKMPGPATFMASAVATGMPGIIIQLLFIPPVVLVLRRSGVVQSQAAGLSR